MNNELLTLYKIWAPEGTAWADWAKPVLFASLTGTRQATNTEIQVTPPALMPDRKTMVILDLPGVQGVEEALGLAAGGFRPVPLYNGVMGDGMALVDVKPLGRALYSGADILRTMTLPADAPPVFLLDSNRLEGTRIPLSFDNRWCVFPQDMPSARYLKSKGIEKVILRSEKLLHDLSRVLYEYQEAGLTLYISANDDRYLRTLSVKKRHFIDDLAYRLRTTMGLKRNAAGGFGSKIPPPYESSGGGYYRMG